MSDKNSLEEIECDRCSKTEELNILSAEYSDKRMIDQRKIGR